MKPIILKDFDCNGVTHYVIFNDSISFEYGVSCEIIFITFLDSEGEEVHEISTEYLIGDEVDTDVLNSDRYFNGLCDLIVKTVQDKMEGYLVSSQKFFNLNDLSTLLAERALNYYEEFSAHFTDEERKEVASKPLRSMMAFSML